MIINFAEMNRLIRSTDRVARAIQAAEDPPGEKNTVSAADLQEAYAEDLDKLKSLRNELSRMIMELPDKYQRIIIYLRYIKGYPPEAIAAGTHMSRRNVFYHLKLAKLALKNMFPDRIEID